MRTFWTAIDRSLAVVVVVAMPFAAMAFFFPGR